jgi:ketosteroid isomerase-like protein
MAKSKVLVSTAAAALVFIGCVGNASANKANGANTAETTAPAAPTKDALVTLEKRAHDAWKSKDAKFWDTFLSDKFVGYGSPGKLDKASATKEYTGADCEIKSYALSDEHIRPLGNGAALITYKTTVHGTCGGQKVPANSWAASVYVRDGDKWKGAFHAEAPVVDPRAAPAKPVYTREAPKEDEAKAAGRDAATDAMLTVEKAVWEAWKAHDAKKLGDLTARDISFINIFGIYLATKSDALKNWSGVGCDAKSVSVTDAAGTMLSPTVGILTFRGTVDGTCYGQKVGPVWGTSVYVKDGDAWKWTFGINVPAHWEGT